MANEDFLKIMVRDVEFLWPRLDQPYRYNSAEKRTEACSANAANAGYSIAWTMPESDAKALYGALRDHYNATKARNTKLPDFATVFGMNRDDEKKTVQFTAKKRAMSQSGEVNKPPTVIGTAKGRDGKFLPLEDAAIWSGSKGDLRVLAFGTTDPDGRGGISLLLDVVQVKEAVYGGDNLSDDFAGDEINEDTDFSDSKPASGQQATQKPAPQPAAAEGW